MIPGIRQLPVPTLGQLATWALALGYGLYARSFFSSVRPPSTPIGLWDVILESALSPQLLTFVVVPAWLVHTLLRSQVAYGPLRVLAWGSYWRAVLGELSAGGKYYMAWVAGMLGAWSLASIGLPLAAVPAEGSVSSIFFAYGLPPFLGLALQVLSVGLVLLSMQLVLAVLHVFFRRLLIELTAATITLIWVAFSAFSVIPPSSPANAGNLLDVAKALQEPQSWIAAVAGLTTVVALFAAALVASKSYSLRLQDIARMALLPTIAVVVLALAAASLREFDLSLFDSLTQIYYGPHGTLVQILSSIVLGLGFAFMFHLRLSAINAGLLPQLILRYGSYEAWWIRELSIQALRAGIFVLSTTALSALFYLGFGGTNLTPPSNGVAPWLFQLLLANFLQLIFYTMVVFVVSQFFGGRIAGLVAIGVLLAAGILAPPDLPLPVGASGMARAVGGWAGVVPSFLALLFSILVLAAAQLWLLRIRNRPQLGGTQ